MSVAEPTPVNFNLSVDEVARIQHRIALIASNEAGYSWIETILPKDEGFLSKLIGALLFWTVLYPFFLVGLLLTPLVNAVLRFRLQRDKAWPLYVKWQAAVQAYRRQQESFWCSLPGHAFEHELAELFRKLGYRAEVTRRSGDKGIDIILWKDAVTTVVQCKQHRSPVGPAVARELLGALVAFGANNAILACTAGFTNAGVRSQGEEPLRGGANFQGAGARREGGCLYTMLDNRPSDTPTPDDLVGNRSPRP